MSWRDSLGILYPFWLTIFIFLATFLKAISQKSAKKSLLLLAFYFFLLP
nr:MAG TPA: hypothetical protein [Caudoviricetes sp.]